ncbi:major facilitator transporter [Caballeronia calidae]|uniref:Major facilitator transporter n=1 Tax=Caballeronia calidae TaxID=1777139 RepID=A0A158EK51_9BURK|nr:MFS transporter [Caballeronia calidae]SAL06786.1 major facilitator transporter [Caballeronia calidae]
MKGTISMEDVPLRRFHFGVVLAGSGGQFSDGFILGIIGIAVSAAAKPMHLDATWMGLIAAASLAGIFLGCLFGGPMADRFGRRGIFSYNMIAFALLSGAQYFVTDPWQLLAFRVLLGVVIGADYAVGKSLVVEYLPRKSRGGLLSLFAVAWSAGYVVAYYVGYTIHNSDPGNWRLMLAVSAIPAIVVAPFRFLIPESPMWLVRKGRAAEAQANITRVFGPNVTLSSASMAPDAPKRANWSQLFSARMRRNTIVGCAFFSCQVIPYFALGTFTPKILEGLGVKDPFMGAMVYNGLMIAGAIIGVLIIDRLPRRTFILAAFYGCSAALLSLTLLQGYQTATIALFGIFACMLSAMTTLNPVYTAELFPTELRASGAGVVIACSRIGSAGATFLLPLAMQDFGTKTTLLACFATLLLGGLVCQILAPETRNLKLAEANPGKSPDSSAMTMSLYDGNRGAKGMD